jgi:ABC-type transporter Mla subunit MlaD
MKKISIKDLLETEDIFKGIRQSANDTVETLQKVQNELKNSAKVIQNDIKNSTTNSSKGLKEFSAAAKAASQVMKDSAVIAKQQAQAEQQKIKVDQELVKLEKLKAQEIARANKEAEKAAQIAAKNAKAAKDQESAYKQLEKTTREVKNQSKELGAQLLAMEKAGQRGTSAYSELEKQFVEVTNEARKLDAELKDVDKSVGDNFRNVGNYEQATKSLKTQLRELTQALQNMDESDPRFQQMTQQAGELRDRISDTKNVIQATAGSAMENFAGATAKAGQIGVAAFQGVEASMQLLGVENENVLEGMRRLQALAGLGDALKTLGGLGDMLTEIRAGFAAAIAKSFQFTAAQQAQNTAVAAGGNGFTVMGKSAKAALSGIRGGIAATGIGLLVVALGTIVAYWDDIKEAVTGVSAEQKRYNEQLKKDIEEQEFKGEMLDAQENTLRLQGKSEEFITKEKIKQINGEIIKQKALLATTELEVAQQTAREKDYQNYLAWYVRVTLEAMALVVRAIALPFDLVIEELNLISETLGQGRVIQKNLNQYISEGLETASQWAATMVFDPNTVAKEGQKAINAQKLVVAKLINERDGLELSIKKGNIESGKDTIKNAEDTAAKEIDIIRRLEDEKMAARAESRQKDLDALDLEYKRKLEDAKEELKDDKDKTAKLAQLDAQYVDTKRAKRKEINDKWDGIDAEAEKKMVDEMIAEDQKQYDAQKKLRDAETSLLKDGLAKDKALIQNAYQDELWDLQNSLDEKKITREEYDKLTALALKKRNKAIKDAETKADAELNEQKWKTTQDFAQKTTDFFKKQSDERIAQMDKEISAAEKQADYYRELAANGNISAKESLAEQERIIAEGNRRKEREQKRQQRMELANTIYQTYAGHAAKDPETALMKTIKDASLLQAFISTLPMFYDGTEDTGKGGGVDGKGGFHAVLHPHERVIPKSLNDQIGNLTNEQLTRLAMEYQNGRLVGQDVAHSSMDLAILASKLDNLTEVIKHKPETNIELGQITQSAMEIVQSTRKGNTTVYNRFKVRS